ncbi:phage tail assembly chaperone [Thauera humireducens]
MALKKTPNPTYKHSVEIPVPGEKPEKVEFYVSLHERIRIQEAAR